MKNFQIKDRSGLVLHPSLVDQLICEQLNVQPKPQSYIKSWVDNIAYPWVNEGCDSWAKIKDYWCEPIADMEAANDCAFYESVIRPIENVFKMFQWQILPS